MHNPNRAEIDNARACLDIHTRQPRTRYEIVRAIARDCVCAVVFGSAMFGLIYGAGWIALQNPVLDAAPVAHIADR